MTEPTAASDWKKPQGQPLLVPSGNTALVRPVGLQVFLAKGMIPNSLRKIAVNAATKGKSFDLTEIDFDEGQIDDMMALFDAVCVYCVLAPKVFPCPIWLPQDVEAGLCGPKDGTEIKTEGQLVPAEDRESEAYKDLHRITEPRLYVDEVDLDDRMFIFNFAVGGTRDVEKFREEHSLRMGALSGRSAMGQTP